MSYSYKTQAECRLSYVVSQYHNADWDLVAEGDLILVPDAGRRIVCQSWILYAADACVVSWTSAGVDSLYFRTAAPNFAMQGFPWFGGMDDQTVTVHLESGGGGLVEMMMFWLEV